MSKSIVCLNRFECLRDVSLGIEQTNKPKNRRHLILATRKKVLERFHDIVNDAPVAQSLSSAFIMKEENEKKNKPSSKLHWSVMKTDQLCIELELT